MSNPFLRRATEYIRDDSAFLAIVSPEPLTAFVAKHKKRSLLFEQIVRVIGTPGSGKTILSQQFAFHNATTEKPALYLSTLSEPLDKILRFGETLQVFDHKAIEDGRVIYEDLGRVLGEEGLENILGAIEGYIKEVRPGIVVIDSFRAFAAVSHDTTEFRRFLYSLTRLLGASATTAVWNAPYTREQAMDAAEFAVADSIISLDIKLVGARDDFAPNQRGR